MHLAKHAKYFGLKIENPSFDLEAVVKRSRGVASQLSNGVKFLMKKNKIDVIEGTARLEKGAPAPKVIVKGKDGKDTPYTAKHVMLATGARARDIPQAGLVADGKLIWTYREAMTPDVMPKRLLVVGSGAIGIEFASFYNELGSEVTVVEVMDRILPVEDAEISALRREGFQEAGLQHPHRRQSRERQGGQERRHRRHHDEGRQEGNEGIRPRHPRHRHCRQCREPRPRSARR